MDVLKSLAVLDSSFASEQDVPFSEAQDGKALHNPYSRLEYVKRLRSYHWTWTSRPLPCDIITCARFGWMQRMQRMATEGREDDKEINHVYCTACGAQLYLGWDYDMVPDARTCAYFQLMMFFVEIILAKEYFDKISKSGHGLDGSCPWSIVPCAEDIMKIPSETRSMVRQNTLKRCETFQNCPIGSIVISDDRVSDLLDQARPHFPADLHAGVLMLGLLGWTGVDRERVSCQFGCSESWLSSLEGGNFDPVAAHAWFCPVVYGSPPAWGQLVSVFSNHKPTTESYDQLRSILDPFTLREVSEILESKNK